MIDLLSRFSSLFFFSTGKSRSLNYQDYVILLVREIRKSNFSTSENGFSVPNQYNLSQTDNTFQLMIREVINARFFHKCSR